MRLTDHQDNHTTICHPPIQSLLPEQDRILCVCLLDPFPDRQEEDHDQAPIVSSLLLHC